MKKTESKTKILKKIIFIVIIVFIVFGLIKIFPIFRSLASEDGRIKFENEIHELGLKGPLYLIGLEVAKIILVFLPGEPIELLAGMCYGLIGGLASIYTGVVLSNILIILSVKRYGIKFVKEVVPEDKIEKIEETINKNPSKSEITLLVLYFLPALPKDFITYVASLLPISKKKLFMITLFGRFPGVFSSVLVGGKILDGDIKSIIIIYVITYIISALITMIYKKLFSKENKKEEINK